MEANLLYCIAIISFLSCQEQQTTGTLKPVAKEDYFEPGKEYVQLIPDSIRTAEQQAVYDMLQKEIPRILSEHVEVKDSILVFNMTRDEFVETGLPEQYYDLLLKDIQNINYFSVSGQFHDQILEEIWNNGKHYKELMEQNAGERRK
ncbi:MAG TPA: hypothetical protein VNQ55_00975 [Parapedobacter sp.]|nr:hypothetical protein [Parapedobacter sp.]